MNLASAGIVLYSVLEMSLYERIGGDAAVMAAVELFYQKVLEDDLLEPFFSELDMVSQTKKQVAFMSRAFDGPSEFSGKALGPAHADLVNNRGLNDQHYDAIVVHLRSTLHRHLHRRVL